MKTGLITSVALCAIASLSSVSFAQSTVDFASLDWQDFGTTNITGVTGNFLPGWTAINATPDLGNNLFFYPTDSLSGDADDAAIWINHYDPASAGAASNEVVELSLDGFTIGQTYELSFSATITVCSSFSWNGNNDALDVAIAGADISDWDSTILNDAVDLDGHNTWVEQSLIFTALSSEVSFQFGGNPSAEDLGTAATRLGFDSMSMSVVPAPSAIALLAMSGILTTRRRR